MKNKRELKHFLQTLAIVVVGVVLYWGLANYKVVEHWLALLFGVLTPFIIGFVLALMLNVPMSFIERNLFRPKKDGSRGKLSAKIARPISLALTYVICAGVIVLVVALVVPSVKETVVQLSAQVPDFVVRVFNKASNNAALNSWINKAGLSADKVIATLTDKLHNSTIISDALTGTINFATDMVSGVVNFFIGLVFSVYMLAQKEKLKSQLYRTCTAFLPEKAVRWLAHVGNLSKATFSNFLSGQGLEACILGSLCALGMKILGFPYAATIGVLVAVTAFIPIVGAFLGTGIGALLILITSFKQAVFFVIFMIILQQIEGNFIYPKVVGKSVGLPSMWVLFAITIGGNAGGIFGMFVAVPICSVLYCLLGDAVKICNERRAEKKRRAAEQAAVAETADTPDTPEPADNADVQTED